MVHVRQHLTLKGRPGLKLGCQANPQIRLQKQRDVNRGVPVQLHGNGYHPPAMQSVEASSFQPSRRVQRRRLCCDSVQLLLLRSFALNTSQSLDLPLLALRIALSSLSSGCSDPVHTCVSCV